MLDPNYQFCPRCASPLAVSPLSGRERRHCPVCGFTHWNNPLPVVAALIQRTDLLLEKIQGASNALSRSLLKAQILEVQDEMTKVREKIQYLSNASLTQLRQINPAWANAPAEQIEGVSNLYFEFAYLTRWSTQLDEVTFQLSLH